MKAKVPISTLKIITMIILIMSTYLTASGQSPYAMFGDNSKMLEAKSEPVPSIYRVGINAANGANYYADFDTYQVGIEGKYTRNAEYYEWRLGNNNTTSSQKLSNLSRSLGSAAASLWNYLTR